MTGPTHSAPGKPHSVRAVRREPMQSDVKVFLAILGTLAVVMFGVLVMFPRPTGKADGFAPGRERHLTEFRLTDCTGHEVTRSDIAGKFLVVNFVFTSCSVSCQQVNQQMAEVQRLAVGQDDVQLVSLTVDPRTDTPAVLAQFAARFGADTHRWLFLTGDKPQLYGLIETSFLPRDLQALDLPMPGGFIGTERLALVDRAGRVRCYFDGMKRSTPAAVMKTVSDLRSETAKP